MAFGEIELWSFRLWRDHVNSDPAPHNFKERTGRVLSALRQLGSDHERVVEVLVQSLRLADKRNTIAHNPIQVQVWEHSETGKVLFEHAITSTESADYIDDAELTELRAEAEDLSTCLYMALGYPERQQHAP